MSSYRGTGRTTKMLLEALRVASTGQTVLVIAANDGHSQQMMSQLAQTKEFQAIPHAKLAMPSREVSLWPQGQIRFVCANSSEWSWELRRVLGYPHGIPTFIDHFTHESKDTKK